MHQDRRVLLHPQWCVNDCKLGCCIGLRASPLRSTISLAPFSPGCRRSCSQGAAKFWLWQQQTLGYGGEVVYSDSDSQYLMMLALIALLDCFTALFLRQRSALHDTHPAGCSWFGEYDVIWEYLRFGSMGSGFEIWNLAPSTCRALAFSVSLSYEIALSMHTTRVG